MNDIDSANIVPSIYTLWQHVLDSGSFILSNRLLPFQQDAMPSISQRKQPTCLEGSGKPKGFASWFEIVGASSSFKANEVASFRQKILADDVSILYLHVHSYNSLTVTVLDFASYADDARQRTASIANADYQDANKKNDLNHIQYY